MAMRAFSFAVLLAYAGAHRAGVELSFEDESSLMQKPTHTQLMSTGSDSNDWPARVAGAVGSVKYSLPSLHNISDNFRNMSHNLHMPNISVGLPNITHISESLHNISVSLPNISHISENLHNISLPGLSGAQPEVAATEIEGAATTAAPAQYTLPSKFNHPPARFTTTTAPADDAMDEVIDAIVEEALEDEAIEEGLPASAAAELKLPEGEEEALEEIVEEALEGEEQDTGIADEASVQNALEEYLAGGVEVPAFEEAGTDVEIEEPLWEIEGRVALAAMALGGRTANASETFNLAASVFASVRNSTANVVRDAVTNVTSSVRNRTSNALDTVRNSTSNALDNVRNSTSNALESVRNTTVVDVLDSVRNTTAGVIEDVRTANVSDVLDSVLNSTAKVVQNVQNRTADVINMTADAISDVSDALQNVSLRNLTSDMISVVRDTAADVFENINLLLDAVGPFLTPALAKKHGMLLRVEDIYQATGVRGEEAAKAAHTFQGDMVPDSESQLELFQSITAGKQGPHVAAGKPWTGGVVKYCFASDVGADVQGHFLAAVAQVERATCLQFQDVGWKIGDSAADAADQRCNAEPAVFVTSRPDYGCYSVVGESHMPSQQLQLQHPGCTTQGVILHEIGHALGMAHEHARPDRDEYIKVNWDNIKPEWTSAFNITEDGYIPTDGSYEYLSLMHYDPYAFSKDNHLPTIEATGGHNGDIGQRNGFAEADIDQLILMYQDEVPGCTGRQISGTGCVNMPGDDGADICTGLAACGGLQNERCCACGGGVEVQCFLGEECPSTPRLERTNHIDCINDVTAVFAANGQSSPDNPCIVHNVCDMELKFKCRETCTHTVGAGSYQADFCHEAPVTDICVLRHECEVWDPSVVAQFHDPAEEEPQPDVQQTEVGPEDVESSSYALPPAAAEEEEAEREAMAKDEEASQGGETEEERAEHELEEAEKALSDAQKAVTDAEEAYEASKEHVVEAEEKVAAAHQEIVPDPTTGVCPRPDGFCTHPGATFVDDRDCDGDCIPDPYCSDDEEQLGFYGSASSCGSTWPRGVCEPADPAKCSETTAAEPVACQRPAGFCTHAGAVFDDSRDCDGDDITDPYCYDEQEQFGFYSSAGGCESTWPAGVCDPFKVVVDEDALKAQEDARILRNVMVVSGTFSVLLVGLTIHSYWAAAGAAAVAA